MALLLHSYQQVKKRVFLSLLLLHIFSSASFASEQISCPAIVQSVTQEIGKLFMSAGSQNRKPDLNDVLDLLGAHAHELDTASKMNLLTQVHTAMPSLEVGSNPNLFPQFVDRFMSATSPIPSTGVKSQASFSPVKNEKIKDGEQLLKLLKSPPSHPIILLVSDPSNCPSCAKQEPHWQSFAQNMTENISTYAFNVSEVNLGTEERELLRSLKISMIPSFVILRPGRPPEVRSGTQSLEALSELAKSLTK